MSHEVTPVTRATLSVAKGGLTQAGAWEKVSALQTRLTEFLFCFLRCEVPCAQLPPSQKMSDHSSTFGWAITGLELHV